MKNTRILYHLMRASFLERTRRYSFLVTVGITMYVGYTFVPPNNANYVTVAFGGFRGVYNSAWIGSMTAIMTTVFLALAGFYVVNSALELDRRTEVGHIIATTPVSKRLYILGKVFSNFTVLCLIASVLAVVAMIMQLVRGEELRIYPWAILAPFLIIVLPAMALTAALATFFETIPWLRRGAGNTIYVFLWIGLILPAVSPATGGNLRSVATFADALGVSIPLGSMSDACSEAYLACMGNVSVGYQTKPSNVILQTFHWSGVHWSPELIAGRFVWIAVGLVIVFLTAMVFDRFDPARERKRRVLPALGSFEPAVETGSSLTYDRHLSRLSPLKAHLNLGRGVSAELRLMLKGVSRWWIVVGAALTVASLIAPLAMAREWLLPVSWIWPLLRWSAMGTREDRNRMGNIVFSCPHPLRQQLPAVWLSGVILTFVFGSGVLVRLILSSNWQAVLAWGICVLFIPSMALALGVWSGSNKLFEVVYTLLWYMGPVSRVSALDFIGISDETVRSRIPLLYLCCTVLLMAFIVIGRRRQIYR